MRHSPSLLLVPLFDFGLYREMHLLKETEKEEEVFFSRGPAVPKAPQSSILFAKAALTFTA